MSSRQYAVRGDDGRIVGYVQRDVVNPRWWIGIYPDRKTRITDVDATRKSQAAAQVRVRARCNTL